MRRIVLFVACAMALVLPMGAAERKAPNPQPAAGQAPEAVTERGTVRVIRLPEAKFELPPGKGRETVVAQCAMCHTLAYITLQPPLSREAWTASVTKMQKTFSAPIPDDKLAEVIDYLVLINGKQ